MRQGKVSTGVVIGSVIGVIALIMLGIGLSKITTTPIPAQVAPAPVQGEEEIITPTALVSCPSDSTTDGQLRYLDDLASIKTQVSGSTCYFMPKSAGQERITAGATSATIDTYSTAVNLPCTKDGTKWRTVCVGLQGVVASVDEGVDFIATGPFAKRDLNGKTYGDLQVRVEDNFAGGSTFFATTNTDASSDGTNGTAYREIDTGSSTTGLRVNDTAGGTSLKVDTDEYIDAIIYMKTNATKRQFGEDGLHTWALVDSDGSSWDEPLIGWQGQATLIDRGMSAMQPDDQRKYSGIEFVYDVGTVGDREKKLTYFQQTAAGVDPGASADPSIEFCTESRYNSNKQSQTILVGCWTDAASQTQVSSANRQKLSFDVTA